MNYIYYTILLFTAVLSSIVTMYIPTFKMWYTRYKTRNHQDLTALIKAEVEQQLKDILND